MFYLLSIIIYFASFFLILSIFLPKRTFGLHELVKSFLLSVLSIILLSVFNYFFIQINLLPILLIDIIGLTQVKKFKFLTISSQEKRVLIGISIYGLVFLIYYSTFATFLAGDIITHATFIRMILNQDPIRIPLLNSYLTDYPKGFHFFASFFASSIGIIDSIKLTSVLSLTATLLIIYLVAKKLDVHPEGAVLFAAIFLPHYFYIFWGGYTSQMAMLFTLSAIYFILSEDKLYLLISLFCIFITQARAFLFLIPFAIAYTISKRRLTFITITLSFLTILTIYYLAQHGFQSPFFFPALLQDKPYLIKLAIVFIPAVLSIPGYFLSENKTLKRWLILAILFLFFMDIVRPEHGDPRRLLEIYYILFSLTSANVLKTKYKTLIVIFLLLYGSSIMLYDFNKYKKTFTISSAEIKEFDSAIQFLNSSKIVNVDSVCSWFFPLKNKDLLIPGPYMYVTYDTNLLYRVREIGRGEYVNLHLPVCVSRYSFDNSKVPFKETFELKNISINKNYSIVYNGSLINILY